MLTGAMRRPARWPNRPAACAPRVLVNLASQEYFRAVDQQALGLTVITPVFKDWARGEYRILSFFAKRARGMMVRYMLERRCRKPPSCWILTSAGYAYDAASSTPQAPVFLRRLPGGEP